MIIKKSISNKNEYGIISYKNKLFFYKKGNYLDQLINLEQLKLTSFKVNKLAFVDKENDTVYYKYDNDLFNNTLYDTLYFNGKYTNRLKQWFKYLEKDINKSNKMSVFSNTNSKIFFNDRKEQIKLSICLSNKRILTDIYNFLLNIDNYKYRCYYSNGDLTDTNICFNNKICDSECAGLNIVISDLSIFFVSILYGGWIYPKYHKNAYLFRNNVIKNPTPSLNKLQNKILDRILNLVNIDEFNSFKKLVIFRLISPFGFNIFDDNDKELVNKLIEIVYYSNYKDLIKNIENYYN